MKNTKFLLLIILIVVYKTVHGQIDGSDNIGLNDIKEFICLDKSGLEYYKQFTKWLKGNNLKCKQYTPCGR